ncbi:XRE family transcriptional regulator [Mesorhizobium sp. Root695]|uniref:helix-turn-helix domain-containing protein n=1 Tax=Mesorhizobium sp. Root695 TaxID=1736589 RepID=UPI00070A17DA|nr:helix-turn-helix transcriptional regulator [Mesorhizobium sp. Root695]KRB31030.1 XRE family transcriptional regulator [Mesorhizobium sp. Root695]
MQKSGVYLGPRLRRLRKDLGLTQANMATEIGISPSYIALMERNQRPVTAEVLIRLAKTYTIELSTLMEDKDPSLVDRLKATMKDPIFADIEISLVEIADLLSNFPGFADAMLRLYTAYRSEQFALADLQQLAGSRGNVDGQTDPVASVRVFLAAHRNCFPQLDSAAETKALEVNHAGGLVAFLKHRHGLSVRRLPHDVMMGSVRRLDRHRREILLDDGLDVASQNFQLAQQLAYLEVNDEIQKTVEGANLVCEDARHLAHRALAGYFGAAVSMPYAQFAKAAESKRYDVEAISRQFNTSFEQTAHRLTTLQKPGQERIPFFFIRVDNAGNVSKRLDSANFPFARHGGGCPLWSLHQVFTSPRTVVTQWLELPDGQRFFSIARTVSSGGGAYASARVTRAVALVCEARHSERMVYYDRNIAPVYTPIGISCSLCHRATCLSRSEPPIGRSILADAFRRAEAPFGFSD